MSWNFHSYFSNNTDGLLGKLVLSKEERKELIALREVVRIRITQVFSKVIKVTKNIDESSSIQRILRELQLKDLGNISPNELLSLARLILSMDDEAKEEFMSLIPRFWTQGSFKYGTLNRPYHPAQEMDIDDGTYLPMKFFENPKIGHQLLTLLVDIALKSLVDEHPTWKFESKRTCARIKITGEKTHIDVPMYAIPDEKFKEKELAKAKCRSMFAVANESMDSVDYSQYDQLDSTSVNLALRDNNPSSPKWMNSDPKVVEDWFNSACDRIGEQLRSVSRFMKAWRDTQWDVGGPSSISLMAAVVEILNREKCDVSDLDSTMKLVAAHLPNEFNNGIESPDDTDERPLFKSRNEHGNWERSIVLKLEALPTILRDAEMAPSKEEALSIINQAFGQRVSNASLIKSKAASPAFTEEATKSDHYEKISSSMVSG